MKPDVECIECLVLMPDGSTLRAKLPSWYALGTNEAPSWVLRGLALISGIESWTLRPLQTSRTITPDPVSLRYSEKIQMLCLARTVVAAAAKAPFDPRQARLRTERLRLDKINQESDYVRVEALDVLPGSEPEHYRVTFLCRGITRVDSSNLPVYENKHQVEILCDDDFPSDVPRLRWVTPIWHPNIQHLEPKGVCVNKAEWLGGMGLDDLCRLMFEMVQYKNYHATYTKPYPLDQDVARWVLEFAEPNGIVNKTYGKSVDDKPFTRPTVTKFISVKPSATTLPATPRIRLVSSSTPASRIKVMSASDSEKNAAPPQTNTTRIKVLNK